MENCDLRKTIDISNSITVALTVATLVLVLRFGGKIEQWQTDRDLHDEARYLQHVGIKPSAATDSVYKAVFSCYHDTAGLSGAEPLRFCADAAASIAIFNAKQEDRRELQKLLASMKSDLH
jgi:hypothetical protein